MLPPKASYCQFCNANLQNFSRPPQPGGARTSMPYYNEPPMWAIVLTYVFAALWIVIGGLEVAAGVFASSASSSAGSDVGSAALAGGGFMLGAIGVLHLCIGIGMLIKWPWVPRAVYIICGLGLLRGVLLLMVGGAPIETTIALSINVLQILVMAKTADLY